VSVRCVVILGGFCRTEDLVASCTDSVVAKEAWRRNSCNRSWLGVKLRLRVGSLEPGFDVP